MNSAELKNIWKDQDSILESSVKLNLLCVEKIQTQRSKSQLHPVLIYRIIETLILIKIILFLTEYLFNEITGTSFVISAVILIIFFTYDLYLCIAQIITILQINYSESVTDIQKKLALLQTHILDNFRLTFLIIPFWPVFFIAGSKIFGDADISGFLPTGWLISQLVLLPVCIYIYRQLTYKNIHKRWVRFLINNAGGKSAAKASRFLNEIYEFEKD
ncbi:MAG TPA: hypothetical protein PKD83_01325 [Ignavibacteria bacterium]|nr:hypothetical protein [Ignavibacteria bacterium]